MSPSKLFRLVWQSISRNKRDFIFSSIGIVIGISTLMFFTALGAGIKKTVLERVFVVRQLEVELKSYDVGFFRTDGLFKKSLNDETVQRLKKIEGVKDVYPKMKLTFPTGIYGGKQILGKNLRAELIADGIPPSLVGKGEVSDSLAFKDWDAPIACKEDTACPDGYACGANGQCVGKPCKPSSGFLGTSSCPSPSYCHADTLKCQMPIPVIASPQMLEVYNGSLHTAMGGASGALSKLPRLTTKALIGFEGEAILGRSFFLGSSASGKPLKRRLRLVGFSNKAIGLGATMPIGYVKRFNARFSKDTKAGSSYHSIVVETQNNEAIASVAQVVTQDLGFSLSDKYKNAQRASLMIVLITLIFNLISMIILAVAAVNIMHTFLMLILERRKELGLMRALGATRNQIRIMVLTEATLLGFFGGLLGVLLGIVVMFGVDAMFASKVAEFPFKPETLFEIEAWMVFLSVGAALLFCWIGALLPAFRASRIDPAAALTGH